MAQFGHYQVISELGRGGMGVVLKAHEQSLNRYVAIKVLSDQLASEPAVVERFTREAKAVAALNHPNIVQIFFIGEEKGQPYFSMEFVDGQTLSDVLKHRAPLSTLEAARILVQAARGLAAAHDKNIIHRDIKPANLMMTRDGLVKLADFGIAQAEDGGKKLTSTGEFVGTPGYLSPEVCLGVDVDARTDIFSLGIVYFEMLTASTPFNDASPLGMMREVVEARIPDVQALNPNVDATTLQILSRMLEKRPEDRYANCHEIVRELEAAIKSDLFSDQIPSVSAGTKDQNFLLEQTTAQTRVADIPAAPPKPPSGTASPPPVQAAKQGETTVAHQQLSAQSSKGKTFALLALLFVAMLSMGGVLYAAGHYFYDRLPAPVQGLVAAIFNQTADQNSAEALALSQAPAQEPINQGFDQTEISNAGMSDPQQVLDSMELDQADSDKKDLSAVEPFMMIESSASAGTGITDSSSDSQPASKILPKTASQNPDLTQPFTQITSGSTETKSVQKVAMMTQPKQAENPLKALKRASQQRLKKGQARVVMLAVGEPAVTAALQSSMEESMDVLGLNVQSHSKMQGVGRYRRQDYWDVEAIQQKGLTVGMDMVILASTQYLGEQSLFYYGQHSQLISTQITLEIMSLHDLETVVSQKRFQVDYTSLNTQDVVREMYAEIEPDILNQLETLWP